MEVSARNDKCGNVIFCLHWSPENVPFSRKIIFLPLWIFLSLTVNELGLIIHIFSGTISRIKEVQVPVTYSRCSSFSHFQNSISSLLPQGSLFLFLPFIAFILFYAYNEGIVCNKCGVGGRKSKLLENFKITKFWKI